MLRFSMLSSIRKFLLVNLLTAITCALFLSFWGNSYLDNKYVRHHLDSFMANTAFTYQSILEQHLTNQHAQTLQKDLDAIPHKIYELGESHIIEPHLDEYVEPFHYQVWNNRHKLILHSAHSPSYRLSPNIDGFRNIFLEGQLWRVFSIYNPNTQTQTIIGQRSHTSNELSSRITQDDFVILLLTYPLLGFLIWWIVGKGLNNLNRIAREVAHRHPNNLDPVNIENTPDEIKPVIDEINHLFHRLQETFEREKRFASNAAHELKTPLAALKTQAQLALLTHHINEKNEALVQIVEGVNRGTHIVQQLLDLSQVADNNTPNQPFTPIVLQTLIRECITQAYPLALNKSIEIEFNAPEKNLLVLGNETTLSILVRNLIDNAIRYSYENTLVVISLKAQNNKIIFEVIDQGPGIPQKFKDRVFERFFRVYGNKSPGSGLGLSIVHQIAKLHQAKIQLKVPKAHSGLVVRVVFQRMS